MKHPRCYYYYKWEVVVVVAVKTQPATATCRLVGFNEVKIPAEESQLERRLSKLHKEGKIE